MLAMALTRKQWNNIIIVACVFMVAILTFLDNKTRHIPTEAQRLFDENAQLEQLQIDDLWLRKQAFDWQCDIKVLNCSEWANAWQNIRVSPLDTIPEPTDIPQELIIQIVDISQTQRWLYFTNEGLLKSPADNWYQIPPSLRSKLQPILDAKPAS